jgi:hypothetical protein
LARSSLIGSWGAERLPTRPWTRDCHDTCHPSSVLTAGFDDYLFVRIPADEPPPPPTEEELELEREMEYFVEPEEALGPPADLKE